MKKIPIGLSDFKELIEEDYYYVDKTLFIDELRRTNGKVILITRPRRFGKTLNLSMLKYFYEISKTSHKYLFEKTAIWKNSTYHSLQGSYPVVFLTFKSIKHHDWNAAYEKLTHVIAQEFKRHQHTVASSLTPDDSIDYESIVRGTANQAKYASSILFLTRVLSHHYKKRVYIIIDEYDTPIHAAHHYNYYEQAITFLRELLTDCLKDNSNLERGYITGIIRAAKEGIFSGLNNLKVCTVLDAKFSDKFGFTKKEMDQFLSDYRLTKHTMVIAQWYDGYHFGNAKQMYNPWSVISCIDNKGQLEPYWSNTSDNQLIKNLIAIADEQAKVELQVLLENKPLLKDIYPALELSGIERNASSLWSLLLFTGYLTFDTKTIKSGIHWCRLRIPNQEINFLLRGLIENIFSQALTKSKIVHLLKALMQGDQEQLQALLQEFIINSMSMFDIASSEPEKSYHLFVLGLLVTLSDTYQVKSNRESGYGRYDIALIPYDKKEAAIVIEFKKVLSKESFKTAASKALEQIEDRKYMQELHHHGIKKVIAFGIAFSGKKVMVLVKK